MKRRMYVDLDEDTVKQILELNTHKGQAVLLSLWSSRPPVQGTFTGADWDEDKNSIILHIMNCDDGCNHWAYVDQIEFVK